MNKPGLDALAETHDVLNGLRHFLSAVEKSANSDTNAELGNIEKSLAAVAREIDVLTKMDRNNGSGKVPLFDRL